MGRTVEGVQERGITENSDLLARQITYLVTQGGDIPRGLEAYRWLHVPSLA